MQDTLYLIASILATIAAIVIAVVVAVLLIFAGMAVFIRWHMDPNSWTRTLAAAIQTIIDKLTSAYRLMMMRTYATLISWVSTEEFEKEMRRDGKIFGIVVLAVSALLLVAAILAGLGYLL